VVELVTFTSACLIPVLLTVQQIAPSARLFGGLLSILAILEVRLLQEVMLLLEVRVVVRLLQEVMLLLEVRVGVKVVVLESLQVGFYLLDLCLELFLELRPLIGSWLL
jgi:hypothetical protein